MCATDPYVIIVIHNNNSIEWLFFSLVLCFIGIDIDPYEIEQQNFYLFNHQLR